MKRTFLIKTALAALFVAPFAFSNAFAACGIDTKSGCACTAECCHHKADRKAHKCAQECKCPCCADKITAKK